MNTHMHAPISYLLACMSTGGPSNLFKRPHTRTHIQAVICACEQTHSHTYLLNFIITTTLVIITVNLDMSAPDLIMLPTEISYFEEIHHTVVSVKNTNAKSEPLTLSLMSLLLYDSLH